MSKHTKAGRRAAFRALRGPSCGPVHRAADLIVRRHGYPPRDVSSAPLEAAEAIRARIARDVAPGARAALVRPPAREGVALREAEAVALLKESTNDGGSGNA